MGPVGPTWTAFATRRQHGPCRPHLVCGRHREAARDPVGPHLDCARHREAARDPVGFHLDNARHREAARDPDKLVGGVVRQCALHELVTVFVCC